MPIQHGWYEGKSDLILLTMEGLWTWQELAITQDNINQMMDASLAEIIHIIVDTRRSKSFPPGMLRAIPGLYSVRHPKRGATMVVGANHLIESLWKLMTRVFPPAAIPRYIFLRTLEEALALYYDWHEASEP